MPLVALWAIFFSVSTYVFPSPLSGLHRANFERDYSCLHNHSDTSHQTNGFLQQIYETPAHFLKT